MNDTLQHLVNKSDILLNLLGTANIAVFIVSIFYGIIGAIVMLFIDATTRKPDTAHSPLTFSWKYFMADNLFRFLVNIILVVIAIRFTPDLFHVDLSPWSAFLIGLCSDFLARFVKSKKDKFIQKAEADESNK